MRILMITGDKRFGPGHPRYELQKSAVEELAVVYWGRGNFAPRIPALRFDVVTVQDPFFRGLYAWHLARRIGAKLNVQVHVELGAEVWRKRLLARFILSRADSVRVVSNRILNYLKTENYTLKTEPIVLPVYVDIEAVRAAAPAPLKKEFPQFDKHLLVAARLEKERDVAAALLAMPEILRSFPKAGLLIAGEGSERGALEALAENRHLEKNVVFLGHRPDIYSLYKSADLLLNTARFESYGASVVEALAAGCPVISTDVGVAREAGAIIVPREELAQKVAEVLTSGARGELKLSLLDAKEWATRWRETLL